MAGELSNKVALVTGAGGTIGRATCVELARQGATVVGSDIDPDGLAETIDLLEPGNHDGVVVDLSDLPRVRGLVDDVAREWRHIDVLVNNGAVLKPGGAITDCTEGLLEQTLAVNVKAPFVAMQSAVPHMLDNGGGSIVNVGSVLGTRGLAGFSSYSASKGAILALTRQVAVEYAGTGIRCNAVNPGTIALPSDRVPGDLEALHPVGRLGSPEEVAEVIAFLAGDRSSFIHGALIPVDGGWSAR